MSRRDGKSEEKIMGLTHNLLLKLSFLRVGEVNGIPGVVGKCVDIRRNTGGEGGLLDHN